MNEEINVNDYDLIKKYSDPKVADQIIAAAKYFLENKEKIVVKDTSEKS